MKTRGLLTTMMIGAMSAVGLLISPSVASAHDPAALHIHFCGSDNNSRCGYGGVTDGHRRAYACDTFGDGYGFRTIVRLSDGTTRFVDDANGSQSGCSDLRTSINITGFRVVWKAGPGWVYNPTSGYRAA